MPTATSVRAVVFDLDDTLYPERDYVLSGFRAVSAWAARTLSADPAAVLAELREMFERGVRGDTFDRWLRGQGLDPAVHREAMVRAYRDHVPAIRAFPCADALLGRLHQRVRTGMITDGPALVQQRKLRALGLARHFDATIYTDELGGREFWKPHPRAFWKMLAALGIEPAAAVYVADNCAKDFLGAREVGMRTIRVRHPGGEHSRLDPPTDGHAPEVTVESLDALEPQLGSLGVFSSDAGR